VRPAEPYTELELDAMSAPISLDDHAGVPVDDAVKIHPDICVTWAWGTDTGERLLIWHWCTRALWLADPTRIPEHCTQQWSAAGVEAHTLVSREPLHLEPSLFWSDCCGMHGFVREGTWVSA
jgi:hypothetical protein